MDLTCFNWMQLVKKSDLPPNAKYICFYLFSFMNMEHNIAWPSQSRISQETGLSKSTVIRQLQLLTQSGWLITKKAAHQVDTGKQNYLHNEYLVNIPDDIIRGITMTPQEIAGVSNIDSRGVKKGVAGVSPCDPNINRNNNKNNNSTIPYQRIIDLYHKILPELPQIAKLTETRKRHIRARWLDDLPTLDDWEWYFNLVRESRFLMGMAQPAPGRKPFIANLDWLIVESNAVKVAERRYHEVQHGAQR